MINTQILEHVVKLAIFSTKINKEKGVSLIILAPPESGKTEILKKFAYVETAKFMTDFNSFHFADFANDYVADKKRTIVIPDFLKIIKKKYSSQVNALGILNAITEEGWMGKLQLGQSFDRPIFANVITALTQGEIRDKRHKWSEMGFLSRFVPLSFKYSDVSKDLIRNYIKDRMYSIDEPFKIDIDTKKHDIVLPKNIANKIENLTLLIMLKFKMLNFTGFRLQRQLQTLALASALVNQRSIVNESDFETISMIANFINFDFKEI